MRTARELNVSINTISFHMKHIYEKLHVHSKSEAVAKALRAGIVWVNHMQPTYVEAPWGGFKQSGFGRELGPWGIEEYLETKQVHINLNEAPIGWY